MLAAYAPRGTRVMVVADSAVFKWYDAALRRGLEAAGLRGHLVVIPSGESSKSLKTAGELFRILARERFERGSWLIALGGGVVGDLTGFVAASFLRGVPYVQVP